MNTCEGYYRDELENELSGKIESPLGKLIAFVKSEKFKKFQVNLHSKFKETIFDYMYSLLTRSPQMVQQVKEQMLFSDFYSAKDLQTITVIDGMEIARKQEIFKNFTPTFFVNKTVVPLILPLCGMYAFGTSQGEQGIYVPLTEKVAVRLIDKRFLDNYIHEGHLIIIHSNDDRLIYGLNNLAYIEQLRTGGGCLISSSKEVLEKAINFQEMQRPEAYPK